VVPAPDEPVTATTGCCLDMLSPLNLNFLVWVGDEERPKGGGRGVVQQLLRDPPWLAIPNLILRPTISQQFCADCYPGFPAVGVCAASIVEPGGGVPQSMRLCAGGRPQAVGRAGDSRLSLDRGRTPIRKKWRCVGTFRVILARWSARRCASPRQGRAGEESEMASGPGFSGERAPPAGMSGALSPLPDAVRLTIRPLREIHCELYLRGAALRCGPYGFSFFWRSRWKICFLIRLPALA
jgi:hypothetical protein